MFRAIAFIHALLLLISCGDSGKLILDTGVGLDAIELASDGVVED